MKKNFLSFLFLIVVNISLIAQQNCPFHYGSFAMETSASLFGDKVNVRATPSTGAAVVANLNIGTLVYITELSEKKFTMGGYTTNWYNVNFDNNGKRESGYVWGGLISLVSADLPVSANNSDKLVYGITSWTQENDFISTARIVRDGKVLTSIDFDPISTGFFDAGVFGHSVCIAIDGNHGFKGIKNVIRIEYIYEACGYSNGEVFLLWDGSRLVYFTKATRVSEAGIFHYGYELVFPDEPNGSADILKIIQTSEEYEESGDSLRVANREVTEKKFQWDGAKVITLPEEVK